MEHWVKELTSWLRNKKGYEKHSKEAHKNVIILELQF